MCEVWELEVWRIERWCFVLASEDASATAARASVPTASADRDSTPQTYLE
jgi:hypothetical protein